MPTAPSLEDVTAYLASIEMTSWAEADITDALASETANQAKVCKFRSDPEPPAEPLPYEADLADALKRRVARNLSLRSLPLGVQASGTEVVSQIRIGGLDAEVRRLEAPHRRLVLG